MNIECNIEVKNNGNLTKFLERYSKQVIPTSTGYTVKTTKRKLKIIEQEIADKKGKIVLNVPLPEKGKPGKKNSSVTGHVQLKIKRDDALKQATLRSLVLRYMSDITWTEFRVNAIYIGEEFIKNGVITSPYDIKTYSDNVHKLLEDTISKLFLGKYEKVMQNDKI